MMNNQTVPSSFRDPSGFLFYKDGSLYRQVNTIYEENYDHLMNSGLYKALVDSKLLVPHEEAEVEAAEPDKAFKVIKPELIPFISYPYEWSFSQLKDAALTTLEIQKKSLDFGMSLKDCSAYNIQFMQGRPIFIDTLSFEEYREGRPWIAYRQFCRHFLAPLTLMSYVDIRLNQLFRVHIDGIPLDLASLLLPFSSRLRFSLLFHLHLHAWSERYYADKAVGVKVHNRMSRFSFCRLLDNLESTVRKLKWQPLGTEWVDYYHDTSYSPNALRHKQQLVAEFLGKVNPRVVWDLGANTGMFSRIASNKGIQTISFDVDAGCVERNYLDSIAKGETGILPLLLDLTNPSPGVGWQNQERMSLVDRGPADTVLALALIHHLAISNNLPFERVADFLGNICDSLIIEFVPKGDSQVQRLIVTREDDFPNYTQKIFEREFARFFRLQDSVRIANSERVLYLMVKRQAKS